MFKSNTTRTKAYREIPLRVVEAQSEGLHEDDRTELKEKLIDGEIDDRTSEEGARKFKLKQNARSAELPKGLKKRRQKRSIEMQSSKEIIVITIPSSWPVHK